MAQAVNAPPELSLGQPVARFEGGGGAGAIVGALVFWGIGGFLFFTAFSPSSTSRSSAADAAPIILIIGGLLVLAGFWTLFNWLRNRGMFVQVYNDGLARINGSKIEVARWDDVREVWQSITKHYRNGVYTGTTYLYTLQTADGRRLRFSNEVKNIEQLGNTIQQQVSSRLLPKFVAAYNNGQAVPFGPFAISKDGVMHGKKSLSWAEVEGVSINNGYIHFKKQGGWFNWANVAAAAVPNLLIFLSLVDHIVGLKRGR
jgi:hypothetical protein